MSEARARQLIKKYLAGNCTDSEQALVEHYFNIDLHGRDTLPSKTHLEETKGSFVA